MVDIKGRSPALTPSSDGVPAVTGGRLWDPPSWDTHYGQGKAGTGALPGATTGGHAAPGSPGLGVSARPLLRLWGVLAVSLPNPT